MAPDTGPPDAALGLTALEEQVRRDLGFLSYPFKPWLPERTVGGPYDVVIVGAGQAGISIAAGLKRDKVDNILVIDRASYGQEGPWVTFARMLTLRSPKYLTGPDWGVPSLTVRAWYEAQHGRAAWDAMEKIPNRMWQDYLLWLRRVLALPVENDCRLDEIAPDSDGFRLTVSRTGGTAEIAARKVVLCTGIEGAGRWHVPDRIRDALPKDRYDHASAPDIDFARFKGRRLAVLGAGASAFDQAATALEAGAASVHLFTRRHDLHKVQPYKHLEKAGFLRGFAALPDLWRWRFMDHILTLREPAPKETVERTARHPGFRLVTGAPWENLTLKEDGIRIGTPKGTFTADHVICGTGFVIDLSLRPELQILHPHIATWADRFPPPAGEENGMLAAYPYLGPGFEFQEREEGVMPCLRNLHLFTFGATLSQGFSGGGMNGLKFALPRLIDGIVCGLYGAEVERHYRELLDYRVEEFSMDSIEVV